MIDKRPNSRVADLTCRKFLIPKELTVGQFYLIIRKNIQLTSAMDLFFFVDNTILTASLNMGAQWHYMRFETNIILI